MNTVPCNCIGCVFDSSCNAGYNMPECRFYGIQKQKTSFFDSMKNFLNKFFG